MDNGAEESNDGTARPSPAPSTERIVDEGMLIALAAVRMAVKNLIIVGALRDHRDYDSAEYAAAARRQLLDLARENDADSARVDRLGRYLARTPARKTKVETENRRRDVIRLGRRHTLHEHVAERLRAMADDDNSVSDLVERARQDAGEEIRSALASRLIDQTVDPTRADYAASRDERLQALVSEDLAALARRKPRPGR